MARSAFSLSAALLLGKYHRDHSRFRCARARTVLGGGRVSGGGEGLVHPQKNREAPPPSRLAPRPPCPAPAQSSPCAPAQAVRGTPDGPVGARAHGWAGAIGFGEPDLLNHYYHGGRRLPARRE